MEENGLDNELLALTEDLQKDMLELYGPMVGDKVLSDLLGYTNLKAFRQAVFRGVISIPIFTIQNRRGKFALTKDVATWLAEQRLKNVINKKEEN